MAVVEYEVEKGIVTDHGDSTVFSKRFENARKRAVWVGAQEAFELVVKDVCELN